MDWPSLGPDAIVFANGGYLYTFDLKSQKAQKLTVYLPGDRDLARPHWANVAQLITDFDISPDGNRAVLTRARRHLHRARQGRQHPQSHANAGHPREVRRLVARRQMDRLPFRSHRRRRDLHHAARRHGQGDAHHHRRQQCSACRPSGRPTARSCSLPTRDLRLFYVDIDAEESGADRPRQILRHHRIRLVAGQQVGGLRQAGGESQSSAQPLFACRQENHSRDHQLPQQQHSRL